MIELERTFLAKYLPKDLHTHPHKEIIDIYLPLDNPHPNLRIRKNGEMYEITKKELLNNDPSHQKEHTIVLAEQEFAALQQAPGKVVKKIRYHYPYQELLAEIDVFTDGLAGLVVVDFEFTTPEEKNTFVMPDFCLADVTSEEYIAGGMLCGKSYHDIEHALQKYQYTPLTLAS